jgi:RNA polymerase sigma factor (sigma-70 family)
MMPRTKFMADPEGPTKGTESTVYLLERFRAGDTGALNRLFERYVPRLRRWAGGRLPSWARGIADTQDLVQEAAIQTFRNMEGFEYRGEGAFQAYLRQAVMNRIRDEVRRSMRSPAATDVSTGLIDAAPSPLDLAVGAELLDAYEAALDRLTASEREAIIGRIELGLTYPELASAMGKPGPDAARMAVVRALVRLAEEMGRDAG